MMALRRLAARAAVPAAVGIGAASWYTSSCSSSPPPPGLDPAAWVPLTLSKVTKLTDNTSIYRFAFKDAESTSGMTVASCLLTKAAIGSEKPDGSRANVMRPYTPISRPLVKGHLELAVKTYPDGKMSQHMAKLKVGDKLDFKGPIVKLPYKANEYKEIGMVAGGTGIAPMLQVADEILENPSDKTKIRMIFANVSESDILLKEQIDERVGKYGAGKLSVYYVVDKAPSRSFYQSAWTGGVGYVTEAMLREHMPPPTATSKVYVCGPPPMYKAICGPKGTKEDPKAQGELGGLLSKMGYASEHVFKF